MPHQGMTGWNWSEWLASKSVRKPRLSRGGSTAERWAAGLAGQRARYSDHSATVRSPADNSGGSGSVQRRRICAHPGVCAAMAAGRNGRLERHRPAAVEFQSAQTAIECEDYTVDLPSAGGLEIMIYPDISGGDTRASLHSLQLSAHP